MSILYVNNYIFNKIYSLIVFQDGDLHPFILRKVFFQMILIFRRVMFLYRLFIHFTADQYAAFLVHRRNYIFVVAEFTTYYTIVLHTCYSILIFISNNIVKFPIDSTILQFVFLQTNTSIILKITEPSNGWKFHY